MSDQETKDPTPKGFQSPLFAIIAEAKRVRGIRTLVQVGYVELTKASEAKEDERAIGIFAEVNRLKLIQEQQVDVLLNLILGGES